MSSLPEIPKTWPKTVLPEQTTRAKLLKIWQTITESFTVGQKFLAYTIFLIIVLAAVGFSIYKPPVELPPVASSPEVVEEPQEPIPSDAGIALISNRDNLALNATADIEVWFTPGESDQLRAAQIALRFSSNAAKINDIQPATGFGINVGEKINNQTGEAGIALAATNDRLLSEKTLLAKISVTRIGAGTISLNLVEFQTGESFYTAFVDQNFTLKAAPLGNININ